MAPSPVPHKAKVASLVLDHPVPVASSDSHSSKKRKLQDGPVTASIIQDDDAQAGSDQASAADAPKSAKELSKLDKGKAKKRRKEEQRALVRPLFLSCSARTEPS